MPKPWQRKVSHKNDLGQLEFFLNEVSRNVNGTRSADNSQWPKSISELSGKIALLIFMYCPCCLYVSMAQLNSCDRDLMIHKAEDASIWPFTVKVCQLLG